MKLNVGLFDRIFRILLGGIGAYMYFNGKIEGVLGIVVLVAGIILALTAVVGFCPLYSMFGIKTRKNSS